MPWIDVAGTDLHYVEEGAGAPLVFLHGFMSCAEAWFQQFEHFRGRYRVIAYDSVNHGMSSNSPRDAEEPDRVDELDAVLAALRIERPVLLGNSMGGNTVLRWAARYPERAAALVPSGTGVSEPGAPAQRAGLRAAIDEQTLLLPIGDSLTQGFRTRNPRLYERYVRIRSTATSIENRRHPRRPSAASGLEREKLAERVERIRSPLLAVVGSLDAAVPRAEELHKRVPRSAYALIDGAPHNVYYEAAAEYNRAVDGFLERALA
jgi:pimeloyl-ACP methyl ester carboxylesterase